jgi:hypothetical protein
MLQFLTGASTYDVHNLTWLIRQKRHETCESFFAYFQKIPPGDYRVSHNNCQFFFPFRANHNDITFSFNDLQDIWLFYN